MASMRARKRLRESIARQLLPNFFMDKLVVKEYWPQIHSWLQLSSLLPFLIRDGLVRQSLPMLLGLRKMRKSGKALTPMVTDSFLIQLQ